ncbi:MAG TPA: hypothetical protein VIG48_02690 [Jatrophihabitans sp.]|jgi:hypothetical protein
MFHPLGDLPQSVYWRRRVALFGSIIAILVLLVLTVRVLASNGAAPKPAAAGGSSTPRTHSSSPPRTHSRSASHSSSTAAGVPSGAPSTGSTGSSGSSGSGGPSASSHSSSTAPAKCAGSQLALSAASSSSSYRVGDQPVLSIVVKNTSATPCVQDLADPQVVMRVYNGESRVWGSHDCKIEPGTNDQTLMPGRAVRVSIVWSGMSSQPNDCANRQQVGAGTYTLYASLSGREGAAAQFVIR